LAVGLQNRRLSLRWFEPNTCHHQRKRPLACGNRGHVAAVLLSRLVPLRAAIGHRVAVVADT